MQTRTRNDITEDTLKNIITAIQSIAASYNEHNRSFFAKKPFAKPLNDLVAKLNSVYADADDANNSEEYSRFIKFVSMLRALSNFLGKDKDTFSKSFEYAQIMKLLITELSLQHEVKDFIFKENAHDYSHETITTDLPIYLLSRYLHLTNDITVSINPALDYLYMLSAFSTTEDALFARHWDVARSQNSYPLWNAFCQKMKNLFAGDETNLPRILEEFDVITGIAPRGSNAVQNDFTQTDVDKFKNERDIFTRANFIKLLTDCMRQEHDKISKKNLQIECDWLVKEIFQPLLAKLDVAKWYYDKFNTLAEINVPNRGKVNVPSDGNNDYYVSILRVNYRHVFDETKNLQNYYGTSGESLSKSNLDININDELTPDAGQFMTPRKTMSQR